MISDEPITAQKASEPFKIELFIFENILPKMEQSSLQIDKKTNGLHSCAAEAVPRPLKIASRGSTALSNP
jgi:hypothetical protein